MQEGIQNFTGLINQLIIHLNRVSDVGYSEQHSLLCGSTIGEHVRHIYNFPECLLQGVHSGVVNYDKRIRDTKLQSDKQYAIASLLNQSNYILNLDHYENKSLVLEVSTREGEISRMETNLRRELHYITEHTVHHMAILRMAMKFHFPKMEIDDSFGFAYSTINYKNVQRQKQI